MDWKKFLNVLVQYEGLRTAAYKDQVGVWTIGIGSTHYPDGSAVKMGDKITEAQAYQYAEHDANDKLNEVLSLLKVPQSENQLIAILSLVYNIGTGGFASSSLLKSINSKEPMSTIEANWKKWNKGHVNGQLVEIKALTIRRGNEWKIYSGQLQS